jgi:hypothetical protein
MQMCEYAQSCIMTTHAITIKLIRVLFVQKKMWIALKLILFDFVCFINAEPKCITTHRWSTLFA